MEKELKLQGHIVYKCPTCKLHGCGNRMVDHIKACDGRITRKLREAARDGKYESREAEAAINTQLLLKEEAIKELKITYYEMKKAIEDDIIVMKNINSSFLENAFAEYYANVF